MFCTKQANQHHNHISNKKCRNKWICNAFLGCKEPVSWNQSMNCQRTQQNCRCRIARYAQRQSWNQGSACYRIICRFTARHALSCSISEVFLLGKHFTNIVCNIGSHISACTRNNSDNNSQNCRTDICNRIPD